MIRVKITTPISGQKSVDVRLVPHPCRRAHFAPDQYVEKEETNDTAIAKLQTEMECRAKTFPRINRELIEHVVGILNNVKWHIYLREREMHELDDLLSTSQYFWHLSIPGISTRYEQ